MAYDVWDKSSLRSKFGCREIQGFVVFYPLLYSPKDKNLVQRPEGNFFSSEKARFIQYI